MSRAFAGSSPKSNSLRKSHDTMSRLLKLLPMCPDPARVIMYRTLILHSVAKIEARTVGCRFSDNSRLNSAAGTNERLGIRDGSVSAVRLAGKRRHSHVRQSCFSGRKE